MSSRVEIGLGQRTKPRAEWSAKRRVSVEIGERPWPSRRPPGGRVTVHRRQGYYEVPDKRSARIAGGSVPHDSVAADVEQLAGGGKLALPAGTSFQPAAQTSVWHHCQPLRRCGGWDI